MVGLKSKKVVAENSLQSLVNVEGWAIWDGDSGVKEVRHDKMTTDAK